MKPTTGWNQGRLWAFPNFGAENGALVMLDMDTRKIWGTTGFDGNREAGQLSMTA